jgi:uncharacterized protein YjiS (DUF1127 family)
MTHLTSTAASAGSTFLARWALATLAFVPRIVKAIAHRQEVRRLCDFDERMLKDIGLTRTDVDGALGESVFSNPSVLLVRYAERNAWSARSAASRKQVRPTVPVVTNMKRAA